MFFQHFPTRNHPKTSPHQAFPPEHQASRRNGSRATPWISARPTPASATP